MENAAIRLLIQGISHAVLNDEHIEVLQPIRRSRGSLLHRDKHDLSRAVNLALLKLQQEAIPGFVLILIDAEDDCERHGSLGPLILGRAKTIRSDVDIVCVVANVMFETWFVASAESLAEKIDLVNATIPENPEQARCGKGWIKQHIRGGKYSETADQAALTARLDVALCRRRSRSFDKLCRELEKRVNPPERSWP